MPKGASTQRLPWWFRWWVVMPGSVALLIGLGTASPLPPHMIDPRRYPAFMDGGTDWGGSNIFFFSRVVLLMLGMLGTASLGWLVTERGGSPDAWDHYKPHWLSFIGLALFYLVMGADRTILVAMHEIALWYVLTTLFAARGVSLTARPRATGLFMAVCSLGSLWVGFYVGHRVIGAPFDAHQEGVPLLAARLGCEMVVYVALMLQVTRMLRRITVVDVLVAAGTAAVIVVYYVGL